MGFVAFRQMGWLKILSLSESDKWGRRKIWICRNAANGISKWRVFVGFRQRGKQNGGRLSDFDKGERGKLAFVGGRQGEFGEKLGLSRTFLEKNLVGMGKSCNFARKVLNLGNMMPTRRLLAKSGTPSKTTLPLGLTKDFSANGNFPRLIFHHKNTHRIESGAAVLIHLIVELLEIQGGLVAARQLVPAKNQAMKFQRN